MSERRMEPAEDDPREEDRDGEEILPLLSTSEFYDLLMEQQEQM